MGQVRSSTPFRIEGNRQFAFRHKFAAFLFLLLVDLSNFKHRLPSFLAEEFERIVVEFRSDEVADKQKGVAAGFPIDSPPRQLGWIR